MKFIINETQDEKIYILRRIDTDWKWITEIVDEGLEFNDPLDFKNLDDYIIKIAIESAESYLSNYIQDYKSETFSYLKNFISALIEEKLFVRIMRHYKTRTRSYDPSDL